ncbi:hypothetical protein [Leifsonia shinshuensis]|uniref:Type I restriction modification DNA specificity domain-containing protein n=1 Tax=Leifsonia shinshuensis TaxID=150026 RepID=A0A853CWM6_9MICO|nr:hypothetical protein [Leifsonia shinshuensis]NYJ24872.1 hypothetical protein [Leifsonia shinshuensis]
MADVWQPLRLKGFQVDPGKGLPFLSAGQVFESQPRVRKWLAAAMVPRSETRYLQPDWIMMSCSGEVGRVTAVYDEHLNKVITHDLLRIVPRDPADYGWLYAYMKTPTFFAIARSSQYGHMIKHLEPDHVLRMPVAMPDVEIRSRIGRDAEHALRMRRSARKLQAQADEIYAATINPSGVPVDDSVSSTVRASSLVAGRRRLEGQFHRADVLKVEELVRAASKTVQPLYEVVKSVTMSNRFKRYFGDNGTTYRSASELFDVNPAVTKRIHAGLLENADTYMLRPGEMIMARSGQTYGLLGRTMVLNENHEGSFGSEDLIRIVPDESKARTGYLHTVLNHVQYGRPRVVRFASGTSVPHLDPPDIREVLIPRFDSAREDEIADLSEEATRLAAEADRLETAAVKAADDAIAALTGRHGSLHLVGNDK